MNKKLTLNGEWIYKRADMEKWKNIIIPEVVQYDLMEKGKIGDYRKGLNEYFYYELEQFDWEFKKEFFVKEKIKSFSSIYLVFEGIDTFSEIFLNGRRIGSTSNMFIPFEFDVTELLHEGKNFLDVKIFSTIKNAFERIKKDVSKNESYMHAHTKERLFVRRAQYSFGWDLGPRIIQTGIWKDVYLLLVKKGRIKSYYLKTRDIKNKNAKIDFICEVESKISIKDLYVELIINEDEKEIFKRKFKVGRNGIVKESLNLNKIKLWYPHNLGEPYLYNCKVNLYSFEELIDEREFKTGFRKVRAIQRKDEEGKSFIIEINGIKTFCKGANWVPPDYILTNVPADYYNYYLSIAKEAGINIIRVWGGGVYESEKFYELCDRYGILVWQDFMFACGEYPDKNKWFRKEVKEEINTIIKRFRTHPSIVVFCGNNETNWELYLVYGKDKMTHKGNYLFKKLFPFYVKKNAPDRIYRVSTPYGGKNPDSDKEGTSHLWDVYSGWKNYTEYNSHNSRFISEFGFQSMPYFSTVKEYFGLKKKKFKLMDKEILYRNRAINGIDRMFKFIIENIGEPKDFISFIWLSQLVQAEAIKRGVEYWRARKFKTSGTLFWQFNDTFPNITWSAIDYKRNRKALLFYAKIFYSNILPVVIFDEKSYNFKIKVINDTVNEFKEVITTLRIYKLNGEKIIEKKISHTLPANDVITLLQENVKDLLKEVSSPLVIYEDIKETGCILLRQGKDVIFNSIWFIESQIGKKNYSNYFIPGKIRDIKFIYPEIKILERKNSIEIKSNVPGYGGIIETEDNKSQPDKNFLVLEPGRKYKINFKKKPEFVKIKTILDLIK